MSATDLSDTLEVSLVFEIGRQPMRLDDLQTLQTGYVFEPNTPVTSPVTIKANGRPIGRGELLQIGDRIGVQLVELFANGS